MDGWLKLHRKIKKSAIWQNEKALKIWLSLMIDANILPRETYTGTVVERGELLIGLKTYAAENGVSVQQLRTILKRLESLHMINTRTNTRGTHITICTFETYQGTANEANTPNNTPSTRHQHAANKRSTNDQQLREEGKKERRKEGEKGEHARTGDSRIDELKESWFEQMALKHGRRDAIAESMHSVDIERNLREHGSPFVVEALERTIKKRGDFVYWTELGANKKSKTPEIIPGQF